MIHRFVPRSPSLGLTTSAAIVMVACAAVAAAERPNRDAVQLRRAASEVVLATVEKIDQREEVQDRWRYTHLTHTLRVERVDQGDLDLLGTTIEGAAWRREWIGPGPPPPASYGHRGLPTAVGDRVIAHLTRGTEGTFEVVIPNGYRAAPAPVAEEFEFDGGGGLRLSGTLLVPAGASAERTVAAALLLPGSGPTDRDGNQGPQVRTDLLKTLAEALADHGIATLRFDKRAHARYFETWPKEPDALAAFFSLDLFVDDAEAGWRALRADPRVDAARTVVIGHSEGGLIALAIGARPSGAELRGLGLLATAGRTLDVVIREQVVRSLDEAGAGPALRNPIMESLDETIASVRERGEVPETIHPALAALFNPSTRKIMVGYFTVDPARLAREAPGSVLVLIGKADIQISFERDAPRLADALQTRSDGSVVLGVLSEIGHGLKPVSRSDRFNFGGPVAPTALTMIIDWAQAATAP